MVKTKIYNVLSHFNKYEQNRLRKFLLSPYFNSDESIVLLFDLIIKYLNGSRKKELVKEKLWVKLSGKKTFDDARFRKYCSDLLKIVESFLAIEYVENNKITKSYLTLNSIKERKIEGLYKSFIHSSKKITQTNHDKSSSFYLNNYLIEKSLYELTESELKRLSDSNINSISKNLDYFYFSEKLKFYVAAQFQKRLTTKEYDIKYIDQIIKNIKELDLEKIPSLSIYYYTLLTIIENENVDHYFKLKDLLSEFAVNFPKNEALSLYYSVVNYCIGRNNKGDYKFAEELFQLYKEMVEKEIILSEHGEISPWDFKNIVGICIFLKKFEWTEEFIENYGKKIPSQYRDNALRFNRGQLFFAQKNYAKVLEQLRDLEYDDLIASLNAKTFTIITFYELDEIDLLFSYIESFRVYLGRKVKSKELNNPKQQRFLRFLNLIKKLTKIFPGDKKLIERFERDLTENKKQGVVGAKWLTEKIAELK